MLLELQDKASSNALNSLSAQAFGRRKSFALCRCRQGLRTHAAINLLAGQAERPLQQPGRSPNAGVDAHVEHAEIDTGRKRVRNGFQYSDR
jgi:hypothetical protein